jgi:tetratricopeptide (TPR) repeat protein
MDRFHHLRRAVLICFLLGATTLAAFWPVLRSEFILVDDLTYVTENPHVLGGLTWENAKWAFRADYCGNWHPLTWLSHMMDIQLFGLNPGRHHLTNLVLHVINSILLFLLFRGMTGAEWRSAMVAALFALHPLHVESVAWVAERKDVLSAFFFLLLIGTYAKYVRERKREQQELNEKSAASRQGSGSPAVAGPGVRRPWSLSPVVWYLLALLLFALGLMSKPMLVTAPFVLLLLDFWPLHRFQLSALNPQLSTISPLLWEKIPFFALSATSSLVTYLVQERGHSVAPAGLLSLSARSVNVVTSYCKYLGRMIWPADLAIFYPHPGFPGSAVHPWPAWQVAVGALFLAWISVAALLRAKRSPWIATGWFWYLGMLVPVIGLVQVGRQAMADRYTYIPLIGIFLSLVWGVGNSFARWRIGRWALALSACATVVVCAVISHRQAGYWHDNLRVFEHALAATSHSSMAQKNGAFELAKNGRYEEVITRYRAALEEGSCNAYTCFGLGLTFSAMGRPSEAVELFQAGLRLEPENASGHNNLGAALSALGRRDEAADHYAEALRLKPDYAEPHYNIGFLLASRGKLDESAARFAQALRLKPGYAAAIKGLGNVRMMQGKLAEAQVQFQDLVRLYPANPDARLGLGEVLRRLGEREEALVQFAAAVRLKPDSSIAQYDLGITLFEEAKYAEAESHLTEAVRLSPDDFQGLLELAKAQARQGKGREATTSYARAINLRPESTEALSELAWLLATHPDDDIRNGPQAVRLAERACQVSGGKEARFWATLDSAYAEAGRFEDAIKAAEKTRAIAMAAGQTEMAQAATARLALYAIQKPFRQ